MRTITCRCENTFEAELPEEVDLDREPGILDAILEGDFFVVTCPHCGERIKPDIPMAFVSQSREMTLRVVPEGERNSWMESMKSLPDDTDILVGYAELYERVMIIKDGLDPRIIEILKYFILAKALASAPDATETPLVSYRGMMKEGRLSFGIDGLRAGELAILALPFDRYEKASGDMPVLIATEPFSVFLSGHYKSVRALEGS